MNTKVQYANGGHEECKRAVIHRYCFQTPFGTSCWGRAIARSAGITGGREQLCRVRNGGWVVQTRGSTPMDGNQMTTGTGRRQSKSYSSSVHR